MPPALVLDVLGAVIAAGASPRSALLELAQALESAGDRDRGAALRQAADRLLDTRGPARDGGPLDAAARSLSLAARSGLPPADLLAAAARRERTRSCAAARAAVRRIEVLLVIPAGLCLLPAFVLLGVAPVLISLFGR